MDVTFPSPPRWVAVALLALSLTTAGCRLLGSEDTTPPEAPSGLSAESQESAIALRWTAVGNGDLTGYNVYRSTSSIEEPSALNPANGADPVSEASFTDETVENGTTYHYVVTALDEAGNESSPSGEATKTPFASPPDRP